MRIVLLGLNTIGRRVYEWLLQRGETVECIITSQRQLWIVEQMMPDLVVSAGFRDIVPPAYLGMPKHGCINLHKSLLPYNRGAHPNVWTIVDDTPAGVSMHYMDTGIDTGPVIAQQRVEVSPTDTGASLYSKLEEAQMTLFEATWPRIRAGQVEATPQQGRGSYHEKRDFDALCRLDEPWTVNADDLIDVLRALTFPPYDNAYMIREGRKYYVDVSIRASDQDEGED